jgi:hypothetical protein
MPDQFVVPQFLDVEPKIIGPITGRQFLILLAVLLLDFVVYRIFRSPFVFITLDCMITGLGLTFAFAKVNGQAFHFIVLNMIQTLRRPMIRVWDKNLTDKELRDRMKDVKEVDTTPPRVISKPLQGSRLSELSLIVNTGGAYDAEGDIAQ